MIIVSSQNKTAALIDKNGQMRNCKLRLKQTGLVRAKETMALYITRKWRCFQDINPCHVERVAEALMQLLKPQRMRMAANG